MARALITGITGQTGSYLAEDLVAAGWDVTGVVRPGDGLARELLERTPGVHLIDGDLSDADRMVEIVSEIRPESLFSLGGLTSVARSWDEPALTALVTGLAPAVLLDAAWQLQRETGTPVRFVQASSAEMFGSPTESPQTENTPIQPRNPYGAAKAYAHFLVASYRALGLAASSCILYNHESPRRPDTFVTRKITSSVARIALGKQDELVLGSLDARRDWGWAPDYARAIRMVAETDPDDFVIATGHAHSVEDFVRAAFAAAGIAQWQDYVTSDAQFVRPNDAAELVGDSSRLRARVGWQPTKDFDHIVAAMVEHDLALESGRADDDKG